MPPVTLEQPKTGVGSTAETNRLTGLNFTETVPTPPQTPATPKYDATTLATADSTGKTPEYIAAHPELVPYNGQLVSPAYKAAVEAKAAQQTGSPTSSSSVSTNQAQVDKLSQDLYDRGVEVDKAITSITNGTTPLNAGEQAQIDGLKQQYQTLIDNTKLSNIGSQGLGNIRGYQTGSGEYDPSFQVKTIGSIITAGANKVADLNTKMASAVAQLTQGFQSNDITNIKSAYDSYKSAVTERTTALQKVIDDTQAAIKNAQAQQQHVQDGIDTIATEAAKNGASPDVLAKINAAGSVADAVNAAGDSLQTGTGQLGDYLQYKRDAQSSGLVPVDYGTWKAKDDARQSALKSSEAYATAFASAKGKAAGEAAATGGTNGTLPVAGDNGVVYQVPAAVAPYVKVAPNGVKYVDASGLSPTEKATLIKTAYNGGNNPIPVITDPSFALDVSNIQDATLKLKDIKEAFDGMTAGSPAARNFYYAAAMTMAKKLQTNPDAAASTVYEDAALDILKAMSGTKGFRGGASIVEQVKSTFPTVTDTQATADQKIENMQKLMDDRLTGLVGKPTASDQLLIDHKNAENNITTNINSLKTTDPNIYKTVTTMFTSLNPSTGQPYTTDDILMAFPQLNK